MLNFCGSYCGAMRWLNWINKNNSALVTKTLFPPKRLALCINSPIWRTGMRCTSVTWQMKVHWLVNEHDWIQEIVGGGNIALRWGLLNTGISSLTPLLANSSSDRVVSYQRCSQRSSCEVLHGCTPTPAQILSYRPFFRDYIKSFQAAFIVMHRPSNEWGSGAHGAIFELSEGFKQDLNWGLSRPAGQEFVFPVKSA